MSDETFNLQDESNEWGNDEGYDAYRDARYEELRQIVLAMFSCCDDLDALTRNHAYQALETEFDLLASGLDREDSAEMFDRLLRQRPRWQRN